MNIFILTTLFFVSSAFSCPNGLVMNKVLNRCLTSAQVTRVMNRTKSCNPSDYECYKKNALDELNSMTQDNNTPKGINKILGGEALKHSVSAAAIAAPLMMITSKIKGKVSGCSSISFVALVAGSAGLVIGENLANYQHKQRLKKIEEEWNKIVKPSGSSETNQEDKIRTGNNAQSEAFEMLARAEDSMVKAAKMKKTIFTAAGAAFGASAAMAIFEMTPWGQGMAYCQTKDQKTNDVSKEALPITPPTPKEIDPATEKELEADAIADAQNKKIKELGTEINSIDSQLTSEKFDRINLDNQNISDEERGVLQWEYDTLMKKKNNLQNELNKLNNNNNGVYFQNFKMDTNLKEKISLQEKKSEIFSAQNTSYNFIKEGINKITNILKTPLSNINLIQESIAQNNPITLVEKKPSLWSRIGQKLYDPLGRSIISTTLAGWSWVMVNHAKKQIEVSTNRAKILRDMKMQFDTANASINPCTSQDRNDPGKPNCYCYNPDHSRNGSRSSTKVCQKLTVDTRVKASNYFGIDEGNFKGCISSNSQFDESCKCRQTKSCMKALKGSLNGLDAGSISMIKSGLEPLEKLTHGMMGSGSVDADGISTRAARIQTATEKLEEKVLTPTQKNEKKKLTAQFEEESIKVASGLPSPLDTSTGSNLPSNPLDASKMLQSEIDKASSGDSNGDQGHSGSGSVALPSGGESGTGDMGLGSGGSQEKLDFGLDTSASQEAEVAEVMKNEMDYGNNDVNTNSTSSLFEVLSKRYQKSGMKRLFESNE